MTTTRFTLLASVAFAGVLTACSTSATVDPTPTTATSVSTSNELATTEVTTSESTTAAPATSPTSDAPATVEVPPTTEAPSTADVPSTSEAPTSPVEGFGLAGQDLADAQAAWDAYQGFRALYVQAVAEPGSDWSAQFASFAGDPILTNLQTALANYATLQMKMDDKTRAEVTAINVQPNFVIFSACVDTTLSTAFDKDGNDAKAPNAPGSYYRHPGEIWVERQGGVWLFVDQKNDFNTQC